MKRREAPTDIVWDPFAAEIRGLIAASLKKRIYDARARNTLHTVLFCGAQIKKTSRFFLKSRT
jgi:hypothetical protein